MPRKLEIEIIGDASSLERAFGRAGKAGSGFGRTLGRVAKGAAIAAGAAGVGALFATLKTGFDEVSESQKVMAQTEAVLKSTGKAAKVSAKDVEKLATSLSNLSGIDDEAIQSGENLLLTFTAIRNEVGKGNDIFNRATGTMLDMSVALGQDMKSSAIQLGKALNDPIRGITALRRVGVSFTDAQTEQIKALAKSGDMLGAQKLILAELNKEFGGSAKAAGDTLPGQLAKARVAFEEVSGELVTALLPSVTKVLQSFNSLIRWVQENMPQIREGFRTGIAVVRTVLENVWKFISENILPTLIAFGRLAVQTVTRVAAVFRENGPEIQRILERVGAVVKVLGGIMLWLAENVVIPILKPLFTTILPVALGVTIKTLDLVTGAIEGVISIIRRLAGFAGPIFEKIRDAVTPPLRLVAFELGLVSSAVKTLLGWIKGVLDKAEEFAAAIGKVTGAISKVGGFVGGGLKKIPGFQHGGPIKAGQAAIVGEAGPELFVPKTGGNIIPAGSGARAAGGGAPIIVNVSGSVVSERDLVTAIHEGLLRKQRLTGSLGIA